MKLEEQVVNLELAKELKKAGVKQESLWWWCRWPTNTSKPFTWRLNQRADVPKDFGVDVEYSAFTVAELGEMLPEGYTSFKVGNWGCTKLNSNERVESNHTEANARAKMLIYLIKENLCPSP